MCPAAIPLEFHSEPQLLTAQRQRTGPEVLDQMQVSNGFLALFPAQWHMYAAYHHGCCVAPNASTKGLELLQPKPERFCSQRAFPLALQIRPPS